MYYSKQSGHDLEFISPSASNDSDYMPVGRMTALLTASMTDERISRVARSCELPAADHIYCIADGSSASYARSR